MARTIDNQKLAAAATGAVGFTPSHGGAGTVTKIPARGQYNWALTTILRAGAATGTIILKGTNNPDPADTSGETLITNVHAAANQQDASAANKGWKYVFAHVTALGAGANVDVMVHGTAYAGLE